jgi:hypothetical protein
VRVRGGDRKKEERAASCARERLQVAVMSRAGNECGAASRAASVTLPRQSAPGSSVPQRAGQ